MASSRLSGSGGGGHAYTKSILSGMDTSLSWDVFPLPDVLVRRFHRQEIAEQEVRKRLKIAQRYLTGAEEVAGDSPETAFLRAHARPGLAIPDSEEAVVPLRPSESWPEPFEPGSIEPGMPYQDELCLVPNAGLERNLPYYVGAWDVVQRRPMRTIHLPMDNPKRLSRLGGGVVLLYQTRHAMGIPQVPSPVRQEPYWQREAALHVFEFGLLRTVAGRAYEDAVSSFEAALAREDDMLEFPGQVLSRPQLAALSAAFAHAQDWEAHVWGAVAHRNALLNVLGGEQAYAGYLRARDRY
jgi:hypothetical protein